ncbi:MAG: hypothetical protein U1E97_06855 [Alphaproteobacteria bacterium]
MAAATIANSIWAADPGGDALATPACTIAGRSDGVERGVNRTNLAWELHWKATIDQMAAHGVTAVRLTLTQPIERSAEIAAYAGLKNLRVLMNVPLSLSSFYEPSVVPRQGQARIRAVRRLSDLDISRYQGVLGEFLQNLDQRGGRLVALEVGNEINWADFNGDLPVGPRGQILDEDALRQTADHARVIEGLRKYGIALDVSRALLRASDAGKAALVIAAGLYAPSPWTLESGGAALTLRATKALFDRLGITRAADALAVHVYPANEASFPQMVAALQSATEICGDRGQGKPCFITEWGFANSSPLAARDDSVRLARFRTFERALACIDRAQDIRAAYLFSWDESPAYSVWRANRLLDGGTIFGDPSIE